MKEVNLIGAVAGHHFSTGPLRFSSQQSATGSEDASKNGTIRIEWREGNAWRLRQLSRGNDPWALPGELVLFDERAISEAAWRGNCIIVLGHSSGGLKSFNHWLVHGPARLRCLPLDLVQAQLRGVDSGERLKFIAEDIRDCLKQYQKVDRAGPWETLLQSISKRPHDLLHILKALADPEQGNGVAAMAFQNFDALDKESCERLFGQIRSLLDNGALANLGIVLLGKSARVLDPKEGHPASPMLNVAQLYTLTELFEEEIRQIAGKLKANLKDDFERVIRWTGGELLLVQALFQRLQTPSTGVEDAIEFLQQERLPVFDTWIRKLASTLQKDHNAERIVGRLLRIGEYRSHFSEQKFSLIDLLVDGWIRLDENKDVWRLRSGCRELLAGDAYSMRGT